jgi:flavin reductase (DIM6/NTAB) family NADH-FMN oxidoreductase RutF
MRVGARRSPIGGRRLGFQSVRGGRNKLAMAGLRDMWSELGVPYIAEAAAHLECDVHSIQAAGDHSMVLGRALRAEALDEFDELECMLHTLFKSSSLGVIRSN